MKRLKTIGDIVTCYPTLNRRCQDGEASNCNEVTFRLFAFGSKLILVSGTSNLQRKECQDALSIDAHLAIRLFDFTGIRNSIPNTGIQSE